MNGAQHMSHVYPRRAPSKPQEAARRIAQVPALEGAVLDYWKKDSTFSASVENRPAGETAKTNSSSTTALLR